MQQRPTSNCVELRFKQSRPRPARACKSNWSEAVDNLACGTVESVAPFASLAPGMLVRTAILIRLVQQIPKHRGSHRLDGDLPLQLRLAHRPRGGRIRGINVAPRVAACLRLEMVLSPSPPEDQAVKHDNVAARLFRWRAAATRMLMQHVRTGKRPSDHRTAPASPARALRTYRKSGRSPCAWHRRSRRGAWRRTEDGDAGTRRAGCRRRSFPECGPDEQSSSTIITSLSSVPSSQATTLPTLPPASRRAGGIGTKRSSIQ